MMGLANGTKLGPYEIAAPLGAGGMGEVYRARDSRLGRDVALKVLPAHLAGDANLRQRFEREARAVSSLNHPHICALYDIGRQDGTDFLVMEYLEGETLARRLEKGALPNEELLRVAIQVADALDKAHRHGVIHRDLKPGNVMLTRAGAKLLDFGLAKAAPSSSAVGSMTQSPTVSSPLTAAGTIVGTFQYMAPEQLEGREADARSDVFSFGAMLYEMATGKKAFHGKSQASLIAAILEHEPQPISQLAPVAPPALERLVRTCLAKDPDERRQTMHDVLLELRWIAEGGSAAGVAAPVVAWRKKREWLAWGAAGALLLAAAWLGVVYWQSISRQPPVVRALITPPEKVIFDFLGSPSAGPPVVSPDGKFIVFGANAPDGTRPLWIRELDSLVARPLSNTDNGSYPFWSPDSRTVGFFAGGRLRKIDVAGGPPITLCDAPSGRGGTWNRDGIILFAPDSNTGLMKVAAAGGAPTPVTKLDQSRGEATHRWPQFLPDGRHFLYLVRVTGSADAIEGRTARIASLDGGPVEELPWINLNPVYASGHLLYVRENTLLAHPFDPETRKTTGEAFPIAEKIQVDNPFSRAVFSASENGVMVYQSGDAHVGTQLAWYDRSGRPVGTLGEPTNYIDLNLTRDRRRAAVSISDPRIGPPDIWIFDLARGLRTRFTFDPAVDQFPAWSPDGSRIAFTSNRKGRMNLYWKSFAGTGVEELLLESDLNKSVTDWSLDGRFIVFYSVGDPRTRQDLWVLPLTGERKPVPFMQTEFRETEGRLSPDSRWMAYASDESGRFEIYVAPFPGPGRKSQVSANGGNWPRWRSDGREIFYISPDNKMMAVEVSARGDTFEVGAARALFDARPRRPGTMYDVTPDGQRFLVNTLPALQSSSPIILVMNWTGDIKK